MSERATKAPEPTRKARHTIVGNNLRDASSNRSVASSRSPEHHPISSPTKKMSEFVINDPPVVEYTHCVNHPQEILN
jgi:hypothetical protein